MSIELLRWEAPGPYRVAFSTRLGGVSTGPYDSLNLGLLTADEPERVEENRRLVCTELGADARRLAMNRQVHGATVNRAVAGVRGAEGDGLCTEEAEVPLLALGADCLPIALVRVEGAPCVAVLHAGRIGLLEGIVEAGVRAVGGRVAAAIGPGIGPCCYEVGEEVRSPYRERFGARVVANAHVDLRAAAELLLREAGVEQIDHVEACTACDRDRFFSHRRDKARTGRQGVIAAIA